MPGRELHSRSLLRGELSEVSLVELLGNAYSRKFTGKLELSHGTSRKQVYFLQGLPVYASSDGGESLIEVARQIKGLSAEETMQLRTLQQEKGVSEEDLLQMLGLFEDADLYALRIEHFMQIILSASGWQEGRFRFVSGDDILSDVSIFDLNPLELIYQGIKSFHSLDLGTRLGEVQSRRARLTHGWEQSMALPQVYFEHSHLLDMFEQGIRISDGISRLYQDLGDINESMLFIYMLLITGVLELIEDTPPESETKGPSSEIEELTEEAESSESGPAPETSYSISYKDKERERVVYSPRQGRESGSRAREEQADTAEEEDSQVLMDHWRRLIDISRSLESAVDYFDWLDLKTESDFAEIREAYARMKEKISLEGAPESVKKELSQYHYKLGAMLDHAVTILTDPQKRYDYEQGLFDKMLQTRQRPKDKEELARQQWRRGTWYLSVANKPELARRCFQQALETDQKKAKYPAYVGWALYIKNKSAKDRNTALEYLEHALSMKPDYDQAHYFLGVIKKRQGEREEALEHFRKALKANPENTGADREYHLMRSRDKQASIFKRLFGKPG